LGASIKDKFGYRIKLKEGHDGIFKVTLNNQNVFDNKKDFNKLPTEEFILHEIAKL